MIIWPGIEGYNYPFQTPYAESWSRFVDGVGQAASHARERGVTVFLEHKNSEPAMKILMRNVGMTLYVIHKLRDQGIDNVKVNMDWQHLIMNGENLAEYAALLAAEGLLGHLHANSGWGTFDDDNMVGATAFMETVELAIELRRAGYGDVGERLGFDLYPYTEDAVGAVKRSVLQWRFIDALAAKIDGAALREAQQRQGRGRGLRARLRGARRVTLVGLDVGTSGLKGVAISPEGDVLADASRSYPLSTPQPGWAEQDPEDWVARRAGLPRAAAARRGRASPGRCTGSSSLDGDGARAAAGDPLERPADSGAECAEIEARVGLERLIELTGNRALAGFTAPKILWLREHEPEVYARIRHVLLPKDYVRYRLTGDARDRRRGRVRDAALRCRRGVAGRRRSAPRSGSRWSGCRLSPSRPWSAAPATRPLLPSASASSRPGGVSVVLGTSGVVFAALARLPARPGGAACTSSATPCPGPGTRWASC